MPKNANMRKSNRAPRRYRKSNKKPIFRQGNPYMVKAEPFPREMITRVKYADQSQFITSATANFASAVTYKVNGLYQPRFSTGTQTVTGYPNLKAAYGRYIVMGAKILITFYDPQSDGMTVGVRLRTNAGGPVITSTLRDLLEQPLTYTSQINDTGSQKKSFTLNVSPWSLNGMTKLEYLANRTGLSGSFQNNIDPTDPAYFDVFALHPTLGTQSVKYAMKIIYTVHCFNRQYLTHTSY